MRLLALAALLLVQRWFVVDGPDYHEVTHEVFKHQSCTSIEIKRYHFASYDQVNYLCNT
jgi:hypothetical protein